MKIRIKRDRPRRPQSSGLEGLEKADIQAIDRVRRAVEGPDPVQVPALAAEPQASARPRPSHGRHGRQGRTVTQWLALTIAVLTLVMLMPGWVVPVTVFLSLLAVVTMYFVLGHDRIRRLIVAWYRRVERRDPARAENLRARAAFWSRRVSDWTATLPESWTQGLYIPDFEPEPEQPEILQTDPFERLSAKA